MRKILNALILPFAFIVVGVVRFIAPWKRVRFGEMWATRLGHLVGNTECYLGERDAGMHPDSYDIWFRVKGRICNKYIYKKYAKLLHVWPAWFMRVVVKVNCIFLGWQKNWVGSRQVDRDVFNLWEKHSPHIKFTAREERKGQRLLRKLGIPEGAKFVCLFVRDSAYLKCAFPETNWDYHDYRDSDVSECIPAAIELTKRDYYVVRVGEFVGKPFFVKHTKIIDYPLTKKRTEFGDLYLAAKCAFFLGTSSGFQAIVQAFNKPIVFINYVPIEYMLTYCDGLVIWKHHVKDGKRLSIKEIVEAGVSLSLAGPHFDQAGVKLEDNTSHEIYEVAMEMADRLEGKVADDDQAWFWNTFPKTAINGCPLHGKIRIRVGREFLKGYQCESPS